MHRIDQRDRIIDRRLLQNAVAEVEDVAGAAGGLVEDFGGAAADFGVVGKRTPGSRLPCTARSWPIVLPGVVEADAPVDADDGAADRG